MSEPNEATHSDGDVVWVKLGPCWWPGEVCRRDELPPGLLGSFRKPPIAVVKFFQETSFEYVKNVNFIRKYDCDRKREFIKRGLDLHRAKQSHMEKFPEDVRIAETRTNGDPNIVDDEEFLPERKTSYADIFGSPNDSSRSRKSDRRGRPSGSPQKRKRKPSVGSSPASAPKIVRPRTLRKFAKGASDYEARILVQPNDPPPDESFAESGDERTPPGPTPAPRPRPEAGGAAHVCPACNFSCNRLSVLILHNKTHSGGFVPYSPAERPKPKSPAPKPRPKDAEQKAKGRGRKSPAAPKPRGADRVASAERTARETPAAPPPKRRSKAKEREAKRPKTDVEIKNSLLADWNEDSDDESMDILRSLRLTENSNSAAARNGGDPSAAEATAPAPNGKRSPNRGGADERGEKRDAASCFDFEDDEELRTETIDRKIPRVPAKGDELPKRSPESNETPAETANGADDAIDLDSEVSDLLEKTTVPELPSLPEATKPPNEKEADPQQIFKTKTFFRSRHSRSQDAIEKYVSDNAGSDRPPTYMEGPPVDADKPSEAPVEPDDADVENPPRDSVKYAPKIQFKRLKAARDRTERTTASDAEPSESVERRETRVPRGEPGDLDVAKTAEGAPSESDSRIAETLARLPTSATRPVREKNESDPENRGESEDSPRRKFKKSESESAIPREVPASRSGASNGSPKSSRTSGDLGKKTEPPPRAIKPRGGEKILNFDVGSASNARLGSGDSGDIVIRRKTAPSGFDADDFDPSRELVPSPKSGKERKEDDIPTFTIEDAGGIGRDVFDPKIKKIDKISTRSYVIGDEMFDAKKSDATPKIAVGEPSTSPAVERKPSVVETTASETERPTLARAIAESQPARRPKIIVKSVVERPPGPNILSKGVKTKIVKRVLSENLVKSDGSPVGNQFLDDAGSGRLSSASEVGGETRGGKILNSGAGSEPSVGKTVVVVTDARRVRPEILFGSEQRKIILSKKIVRPTILTSNSAAVKSDANRNAEILRSVVSVPDGESRSRQIEKTHLIKHKGAILNPKGQLFVSGNGSKRTILTTMPGQAILTSKGQIIAPQSSIITSPAKIISNVRKPCIVSSVLKKGQPKKLARSASETLSVRRSPVGESYVLAQKSGGVARLTAAELEQFQRTGRLPKFVMERNSARSGAPSARVENQKYILTKYIGERKSASPLATEPEEKPDGPRGGREVETFSAGVPSARSAGLEKISFNSKKQNEISVAVETESEKRILSERNAIPADDLGATEDANGSNVAARKKESFGESCVETIPENLGETSVETDARKSDDNAAEDDRSLSSNSLSDPQKQFLAVPGENFGGPPDSFFLCVEENGTLTPVNNQPLVLENNQLVPMTSVSTVEPSPVPSEEAAPEKSSSVDPAQILELPVEQAQRSILINTGDQQILVDQQAFLSLLAGDGQQLVTADGQNLVLQGGTQQLLSALAGSPELANLLAGGQQVLLNSEEAIATDGELQIVIPTAEESEKQPSVNQDILAAALAGTEVFQPESLTSEATIAAKTTEGALLEMDSLNSSVQKVNTNTVYTNVFETSSTLNQPIMSPLEHPTKKRVDESSGADSVAGPKNLEDSLAVIGVATTNVPTSLELPITVTNPRIAVKTQNPLELNNTIYQSGGLIGPIVSSGIFTSETSSATLSLASPAASNSSDNLVKDNSSSKVVQSEEKNDKDEPLIQNENDPIEEIDKSGTSADESIDDIEKTEEQIEDESGAPSSMPFLETETSISTPAVASRLDEDMKLNLSEAETESVQTSESKIANEDQESTENSEVEMTPATDRLDEDVKSDQSETDMLTELSLTEPVQASELKIPNDDQEVEEKHSEVVLEEAETEIHIPPTVACDKSDENSQHMDTESEEICADTPPDLTHGRSPIHYDDQDAVDDVVLQNEAENSVSDHVCDELNISSIPETAVPDSTSSSIETGSTPEPPSGSLLFSDSSSDNSTEIPLQPAITVSHHLVQNFSSLLNRTTPEDKSNDCTDMETCENFEENDKKLSENYDINSER